MPDLSLPPRILELVGKAYTANKKKGLDTILDIHTKSGNRSQLLLDEVCTDGYVGRSASVTNAKGKRVNNPMDEAVTMKVTPGVVYFSDSAVETIQMIAVNTHPRNIPAMKQ
jgi:hypothetical protein